MIGIDIFNHIIKGEWKKLDVLQIGKRLLSVCMSMKLLVIIEHELTPLLTREAFCWTWSGTAVSYGTQLTQ